MGKKSRRVRNPAKKPDNENMDLGSGNLPLHLQQDNKTSKTTVKSGSHAYSVEMMDGCNVAPAPAPSRFKFAKSPTASTTTTVAVSTTHTHRFAINAQVEAKTSPSVYTAGTIIKHNDAGNAYRIRLKSGKEVFAPVDTDEYVRKRYVPTQRWRFLPYGSI